MPGLNPKQAPDIDQFVAITQASPADAARFLGEGVTLEGAIEDYFAAQAAGDAPTEDADEDMLDAALAASTEPAGGARTLSGAPAEELPESWRRREANIAGVLDDENRREGNELYTGGERSGLAVQNPNSGNRDVGIVNDILQQAREGGREEDPAPRAQNPWARVGAGHTLGSEDTPSAPVGGSAGGARMPGAFGDDEDEDEDDEGDEQVERRLTFWRDGFSIEDGPLHRYDDPRSQEILNMIRAGRAPLELFDLRFNQALKIEVDQRVDEDYQEPARKPAKPFSGGGNRLGSATPEVAGAGSAPAAAVAPAAPPAAKAEIKVDESKPSTTIQLRLGDGTRLVVKVNLDHTVADLRGLASSARSDSRAFVLQTTFPNRELSDNETIEQAGLKNAVVVQRYV
ncbi:SEP-domain-containing protein [Cutaneotrichosporon oleaginosum]|uniref:SEP-domain-containing protein n=1 Tax=Cutaneotrichosporon oleaginosum TaxID=879819 RepID=A0A0J0XD73_9TREE|nr:SEP-domain-containing protein [Cutaneotrichosporon oleaginosum]KLT38993.1 SEP-domain-containing protein [Cutaneotrichosporon oleaginosum]